jgi:RNA polymerase sigma-32 factor
MMPVDTAHDRSLDQYIAEINRHPLLTRSEEHAMATDLRATGNPAAGHKLIISNLRFVVKIAHGYRGYGLRLMDLIQEGNIGLMMAVRKFEPSRGYRFISYAVWWVRAYMQNYIMRSWSLVKVGTTQAQRKLFFKLRGAQADAARLSQGGDRATDEELATALGVLPEEVRSMGGRMAARDFSLDAELQPGAGRTHGDQLMDQSSGSDVEAQVLDEQEREMVRDRTYAAMENLNEKERFIVINRLMCDEPHTLQQIGTHFQISRERARQIEGNVLRKMKVALRHLHTEGVNHVRAPHAAA